ncbi:hypothetical protein BU26DRAFT_524476 [Trematosphaeria pertusa]|uniref:Gfd2/YDR514C-like C-terminal domain-containing protein n=1 Tax=Trematosphaeria pertusa TaxID=390896 RepID=A0A6A6HWN6_9PLEO|nr:uncharacterized protein BU26DRAFT_524476 [Trematosphaeria pertusa]KAF2242329.1 hypothetical protein BU26DRAFT_524476 [Trematosphaeria pertusa]
MSDSSRRSISTSPTPPPQSLTELQLLSAFFYDKSQKDVLKHCLGLEPIPDAPALANSAIVVCFDTEGWTADPSKITEVGLSVFDSRDLRPLDPGPHGENYLKQIWFYHIRIQPNAHLLNIRFCVGHPETNRFGQTRFLTPEEAQGCLKECFGWHVDPKKPELGYCPVVVVGHALGNDLRKLYMTLGFDPYALGNIVKVIDTQQLARQCGKWSHAFDQIGLERLVGRCGFAYRDAHTASNDAAMTIISAIQMVLPKNVGVDSGKSVQNVVDIVEKASKAHSWSWGSAKYCLRCGSRGHTQKNFKGKPCYVAVKCHHCVNAGRIAASNSHRTECCISYTLDQAVLNRVPKIKVVPAGADSLQEGAGESEEEDENTDWGDY